MNAVAAIERPTPPAAALIADRVPDAQLLPAAKSRAEWLAQRMPTLNGSEAAVAAGLSPWKTPLQLFYEKCPEMAPPGMPEPVDTPPMYWGRKIEPIIVQAIAESLPADMVFAGLPMMRSIRYPFMGVNLDGLAASGMVVEAKNVRMRNAEWGEPQSGEVPIYYMLQAQHSMVVTGLKRTVIGALFGGCDLQLYYVEADPELQGMLIDSAQEFMTRVQRRDPPPARNIDDAVLRFGRVNTRGQIVAAEADLRHVQTLRDAREAIEALGKTADESKQWIMETLGDKGDTLVDAQGKALVTWKLPAAPQRFDVEAFAAKHPDLYAQFMRAGTASRRFLVKD